MKKKKMNNRQNLKCTIKALVTCLFLIYLKLSQNHKNLKKFHQSLNTLSKIEILSKRKRKKNERLLILPSWLRLFPLNQIA